MNNDIKIGKYYFIVVKEKYIIDKKEIPIKSSEYSNYFKVKSIWGERWIKENRKLNFIYTDEADTYYGFDDGELKEVEYGSNDIYIFENEGIADKVLKEFNILKKLEQEMLK